MRFVNSIQADTECIGYFARFLVIRRPVMQYMDLNEARQHGTSDFPFAFYHLNREHPRYQMNYHWHPEYELIRVLEGELDMTLDERHQKVRQGDLVLVSAGVLHSGEPKDCVYECLVFDLNAFTRHNAACAPYFQKILDRQVIVRDFYPAETGTVETEAEAGTGSAVYEGADVKTGTAVSGDTEAGAGTAVSGDTEAGAGTAKTVGMKVEEEAVRHLEKTGTGDTAFFMESSAQDGASAEDRPEDPVSPEASAEIRGTASEIFDAIREEKEGYELVVFGRMYLLFEAIYRNQLFTENEPQSRHGYRKIRQLRKVLDFIDKNYSQPITLEQLADAASMSPKYFCRFFSQMTHRTPMNYLNYQRIEHACYALSTGDLTVTEVAYACGFNDLSYFIKTFRKYKGVTPGQYRR